MRLCRYLTVLFLMICLAGCGDASFLPSAKPLPLSDANRKLIEVGKSEYNLDIKLFPLENTLWVYVPLKDPLKSTEVNDEGPSRSPKGEANPAVFYLDGAFTDGGFRFQYDFGQVHKYPVVSGYGDSFSKEFQEAQQNVQMAVFRAYADVEPGPDGKLREKIPGDVDYADAQKNQTHKALVQSYVKTRTMPEFVVIVLADVTTGLKRDIYLYYPDLKRAMSDQFFLPEYRRRVVFEDIVGMTAVKGDKDGSHLTLKEVTWPEFLAKQTLARVRQRYLHSDKPPPDDPHKAILEALNASVSAYDFKNFSGVTLEDAFTRESTTYPKKKVMEHKEE